MVLCDYKLLRLSRDKKTITVDISIYEGEITTLDERDIDGSMVPVTRYRRSRVILGKQITFNRPFADKAIHANLRGILKEIPDRTPILEQNYV